MVSKKDTKGNTDKVLTGNVANSATSNPILTKNLPKTSRTTVNRLYGGYQANNMNDTRLVIVDYEKILKSFNLAFRTTTDLGTFFEAVHNILSEVTQINFSGLGIVNKRSNNVDVRFIDKSSVKYSTKIMLNDYENCVTRCYDSKEKIICENSNFLNVPYLSQGHVVLLPLITRGECIGILMVGDNNPQVHIDLYEFLSNSLALIVANANLNEIVNKNTDLDSLTKLANHKSLQEELARQLELAKENSAKLSICLFDISNISQINRELGHAKGDEIIKTVASTISKNNRNTDFAGRYGGDEICIVMPNTTADEAKYIAEYLTYLLSCVCVDDVGVIKVNAGIATYPDATSDQEKLLILAEQAMCISKSKSYENGNAVIVTSQDVDFWDNNALKSYAEVLTKRHAQVGISFEEELVSKFHSEKIISNQHLLDVVTSLAGAIDAKDTYTKGHSTSVSRYSEALARAINLPEADVERIKLGALLHDVGKIGIPETVLRKPTALNDDEWAVMKQHPIIGVEKVLAPNESLRDLIPIVKFHHEHYDGTGYPFGLKGEEIPLSARIVAIADSYHALVSDRPYRKGLSVSKACEILKMGANTQWDRELVRQFILIAPSLSTTV